MDEDVRALVRTWAATQTVEDGVRAARARLRAGLLPERYVQLAMKLDDPIARELGVEPAVDKWSWPRVTGMLERCPEDVVRDAIATLVRRIFGADVPIPSRMSLVEMLTELHVKRDARIVAAWTGEETGVQHAITSTSRRDQRWLERRVCMTLLFGPELLPPPEPWTLPTPPRPQRPRPLMGP